MQPNTPTIPSMCNADKPQCAEATLIYSNAHLPRWKRIVLGRGTLVRLRDTKLGDASPAQWFTPREWRAWLQALHTWRPAADGMFRTGDLAFTRQEVVALVDAVDAGEFDLPAGRVVALV